MSAIVAETEVSIARVDVGDESGLTLCIGAMSRLEAPEMGTGLNSK